MLVEGLGDDVVGVGEDRVELRVVGCGDLTRDVVGSLRVHRARPVRHGRVVADDRVHRIDLDLDQVAGVLGHVARLGDDEGDRLAREAHVSVGQHTERTAGVGPLVVEPRRDDLVVEVGAGEHVDDAGELARRRDVEAHDRPGGDVAAQERDVQQAWHRDVVDVGAVPGHEAGVLATEDPLADEAVDRRSRPAASEYVGCDVSTIEVTTAAAPRPPSGPP